MRQILAKVQRSFLPQVTQERQKEMFTKLKHLEGKTYGLLFDFEIFTDFLNLSQPFSLNFFSQSLSIVGKFWHKLYF